MSTYTNPKIKINKTPYFISPPRGVSSNRASQCIITPENGNVKKKKKNLQVCVEILKQEERRPGRKGDIGLWSNGPCKVVKPGNFRGPGGKNGVKKYVQREKKAGGRVQWIMINAINFFCLFGSF